METATLVNFKQKFNTPPPVWFKDVKEEAYKKITTAPFAEACRRGDKESIKKLIVGLWPFVDVFPRLVGQKYMYLFTNPRLYFRHGPLNMLSLASNTVVFLRSIASDEKSHRLLWLDSGSAVGLEYPENYAPISPQTQVWKDGVANETEPSEMLFGYVAIEIIAESVSKDLIHSDIFKSTLGEKGMKWFLVHTIDHGDISHENLELQLALAFHRKHDENISEIAARKIMKVVDDFLASANACV
ncbi:MAG: hypothetical protein A3J55_00185 [Candidatus Ryanbacteria bacterium RIFCSPHIGHO2_02_FULL_45_17b]|uniref:Uncharacterized protein n=1 Tax=Candidatus Ryanbacteria bacterium RIFCSPHIGHO2_01_FULL_45_22 TaxID=1802114 RepID=A0A1G2G1G7_9BACT|nr:MAG: hypothetical protein A2719_02650 [Candidatus Ryanbacteria bacterium RIFCSPHIGHO2_01_FULL_45_22]OGZ46966.1 MAG: hypothetical protein A3J55_00185 [Candidatus Ryanbacteria bacterium RIFCSPHIGHO2_02_FULL_45_17b]